MTATQLTLTDARATAELGRMLGQHARRGDCLLLYGDLGAGKTCLTQGLAAGLGVDEVVASPTFSLLNEYAGRLPLSHFDLYRLTPAEIGALGFVELWDEPPGVVVIEWPERTDATLAPLPEDALQVRLSHSDGGRLASIDATGPMGARWWREVQGDVARG